MNSKLVFFFLFTFIVACGVKGPPTHPAGSTIPSLVDQYMTKEPAAAAPTPTPTPNP